MAGRIQFCWLFFLLQIVAAQTVWTDNPIITHAYSADPAAHVFEGRVYIYCSNDSSNDGTYWNMTDWHVFSSANLVDWTDHGPILDLNDINWATEYAWAPDCGYRDGTYYFYYPVDRTKIGVATSAGPAGPFVDPLGYPLIDTARDTNAGAEPIDPAVFIDDDGQAYLYFGCRDNRVVKLRSNMVELDGNILSYQIQGADNYAEAPWVYKRNSTYYLSYSTGWPGQIAYATSTNPLGPFTYRGIVLDYIPDISTNHQSIIEYRGQWYMVYHNGALSNGNSYKRSVCIDYLYHNSDGIITMVNQTTGGVAAVTVEPGDNLGDVNEDNTVDIVDALVTAQYYVGLNPQGFNQENADVNCDNIIDIVDALVIAQYYVGLITTFPCDPAPTPTPVAEEYTLLNQSGWSLFYVDSEEISGENGAAINFFDGNISTIWHTEWEAATPVHPHEIQIDLGGTYDIGGIRYLPRQDGNTNGMIAGYEVYISTNTGSWGNAVAYGTWANDTFEKEVTFGSKSGRYIRLVALSEVNGGSWTSGAELNVLL